MRYELREFMEAQSAMGDPTPSRPWFLVGNNFLQLRVVWDVTIVGATS